MRRTVGFRTKHYENVFLQFGKQVLKHRLEILGHRRKYLRRVRSMRLVTGIRKYIYNDH